LFLKVVDVELRSAGLARLFVEAFEFFLLADVRAEGDHLGVIFFFKPREEDRGVQAARICQHDLHESSIMNNAKSTPSRKLCGGANRADATPLPHGRGS